MKVNMSDLLQKEKMSLASYAMASLDSSGRVYEEKSGDDRLPFQKDRDRIIHCKAFRRLNEKTQVFVAGSGDHYRTRLSHSLEVAQVSRDISRWLGLNEDLSEAIALAHDLGHPPFAHAGQDTLHNIMKEFGLHFEHNDQSRRVVEKLEKVYPEFDGLNLTIEVIDGLIKHHTPWDQPKMTFAKSAHLEAQVVNLADEIAYTCHDIDDGFRSGIIKLADMKNIPLWQKALQKTEFTHGKINNLSILKLRSVSALLGLLIEDVANQTTENIAKNQIKTVQDVRNYDGYIVEFSPKMATELAELRKFLYKNFYMSAPVTKQFEEATKIMKRVFDYYLDNLNKLPAKYRSNIDAGERKEVVVKDYLAGMTDGFFRQAFESLEKL